jgi:hypothetical protein
MHVSETSTSLALDQKTIVYQPGTLVRVTQQIPRRIDTYTTAVTGKVVRQERQNSASWFARNKCDRIWLDRLLLEKADGEVTILNLDEYSVVEILQGPPAVPGEAPLVQPAQDATAHIT